jgi:hypothetical protein
MQPFCIAVRANLAQRYAYLAVAIAATLLPASAGAADSVSRFRMEPDRRNAETCHSLDDNMALEHTVTVRKGDAEIASRGGIVGRMSADGGGIYQLVFELEGRRVDVIADFALQPGRLTVTERDRPCRWSAAAEK